MLNGAAVEAWPVNVPVPLFLTTNVASACEPTPTVPKSAEAGVTASTGCGAGPPGPTVHSSDVPSVSTGVLKPYWVATSGPTWIPTVADAPPSRSGHSPPTVVSG